MSKDPGVICIKRMTSGQHPHVAAHIFLLLPAILVVPDGLALRLPEAHHGWRACALASI